MNKNNIKKYLQRIGINHELECSLDTLKLIQRQHMMHVPFENLDLLINRIDTDITDLYHRIVELHRGGICYELNLLCSTLLQAIGFKTKILGANVSQEFGNYYDHLLIIVTYDDQDYIFDASFTFIEPLIFKEGIQQNDAKGIYQITSDEDSFYRLEKFHQETNCFKTEYIIHDTPTVIKDFQDRMDHLEKNDSSLFRKNIYCTLLTGEGKFSLKTTKLQSIINGENNTVTIETFYEFNKFLEELFHIFYNNHELSILEKEWCKIKSIE